MSAGSRPSSTPDVLFAQKASAITKAAGYDPKTIDLETFRSMAPDIFIAATQAIYKENIPGLIEEPITQEDLITNYQYLIDTLYEKTNNSTLQSLSGEELMEGSHRAIGVIVGVVFAEGQRLWLEKCKDMGVSAAVESKASDAATNYSASSSKSRSKKHTRRRKSQQMQYHNETSYARKETKQGATDLGGLLDRIKYLEQKLAKQERAKSEKGSRRRDNYHDLETHSQPMYTQSARLNGKKNQRSPTRGGEGEDIGDLDSDPHIEEDDGDSMDGESAPMMRRPRTKSRNRPRSAPLTRRRQEMVTQRLFTSGAAKPLADEILRDQKPRPPPRCEEKGEYTYDLKSGRRILLSKAAKEEMARRQMERALEQVKEASTHDFDSQSERKVKKNLPGSNHHEMVVPAKLPARLERSVNEWVKKSRETLKESNENRKVKRALTDAAKSKFLIPRFYGAYNRLAKRDLVITIEHCHSCSEHDTNTRHVASKYTTMADFTLKMISEICHEMCLSVRVGVFRFKARITLAPGEVDSDSRIGAFEVQVAYCDSFGDIHHDMLHSKLATTFWPSKSALKKKMETFSDTVGIHKHVRDADAQWMDHANDGLKEYPVGVGPWAGAEQGIGTPLGDEPDWEFPTRLVRRRLVVDDDDDQDDDMGMGSPGSPRKQKLYNVNWVYDSRNMVEEIIYSPGQPVRILGLRTPNGKRERYALYAVVKAVLPAAAGEATQLMVRLKYHDTQVCVSAQQCAPVRKSSAPSRCLPDVLPSEIEGLLLLANRFQDSGLHVYEPKADPEGNMAVKWLTPSGDDRVSEGNHVYLTRSTFFHQVRRLAAVVEEKLQQRGLMMTSHDAKNPASNAGVDLQLAYSEEIITWVFQRFGRLADMSALENFAIDNFEGVSGIKLRKESQPKIEKPPGGSGDGEGEGGTGGDGESKEVKAGTEEVPGEAPTGAEAEGNKASNGAGGEGKKETDTANEDAATETFKAAEKASEKDDKMNEKTSK
jgi:hypothetical protein